jgi:hypothetical protein
MELQVKQAQTETHTKRQATQQDCLPSLLGNGEKRIEIVYGKEKIFCTGPTRAAKAEQKSFVLARQAQQTNQGWIPFICTLGVPIHLSFDSARGHPSLNSLSMGLLQYSLYLSPLYMYVTIFYTHRLELVFLHAVFLQQEYFALVGLDALYKATHLPIFSFSVFVP